MRNAARLLLVLATLLPAVAEAQVFGGPKLTAKLYAAHDAVAPGGETELAVELTLSKGWHIYHPIMLDTGLPTEINFELPAWATVGDLRFPVPHIANDQGIEYLSVEGTVVVLTTLKLAADAPLGPLEIKAKIASLACMKQCVPADAEVSLTLNVAEKPGAAANQELFDAARSALPKPLAEAELLKGSRLVVSHTQVPPGAKATLAAIISIEPKHHIQDREPGQEDAYASRLFVESTPSMDIDEDEQLWPKPQVRTIEGIGRVREQSGEIVIQAPFEVGTEDVEPGPVRLRALFLYQSCDDAGLCSLPAAAEGFFDFEIVAADAPAVASTDPIFEKLAEQAAAGSDGGGSKELPDVAIVLLWAFLGGVILNVMPCVLPVISLKIFGFMQQAGDDRGKIFRMGLVYAAGIMASFAVLALLMTSAGLAWGGLMQRPGFLIGLSAVVFAFALSLLGVFELQLPGAVTTAAGAAASKEGYGGAFMNGVFATLLATPCVGPFLGPAVGILVQLPPAVGAAASWLWGWGWRRLTYC